MGGLEIKITAQRIVAVAVFLITLAVFISTVAPTTSFWDCGEFITASFTMGVPHPPGTPLYVMLGRLFSLLPTAGDIGLRVNLMSPLVSAFSVLFLYLCIIRLARVWRGPEKTASDKIAVYGSAAVGALCFAFSHSFWFNGVEAEVYAMSLFFTALAFYLGLRWLDFADQPAGNRILLLIFYVIGLSSGIHLLNILALVSVTLIIAFHKFPLSFKTLFWGGMVGSGIILAIYPGIIQGFPLVIETFTIWAAAALIGLMVWASVALLKRDQRLPAMAVLSALLVILGYSTFLVIKIRSGLDPFLDENDPQTWHRLLSYLNREQYGTESLLLNVFNRKAPFWTYQINKMYLRYLGWQYLNPQLFFGIPFLLGIIGVIHQFYKDAKGGWVVLSLFIMTGLAVVLYLNQDDPQPRERDYAYVGSFFAFAIWIGLGSLAVFESVLPRLKKEGSILTSGSLATLLLVAAPLNMLVKNYHSHNRSGNYVAWDYSYNLLMSCAPNAILYTNGDNDTFPVWYLQETAGVRKDVRIANLSLLNTGWFIEQIRDKEPKVPMTSKITDDYISNVIESNDMTGLMDRRWPQTRKVKVDGPTLDSPPLIWDVPAALSYPVGGGKNEYFLRVQDIMILNTMVANRWDKPMYFAVTVSDNNLLGLRDVQNPAKNYLTMEGLAFRLHPQPSPLIDPDQIAENMLTKFKYRNTDNPNIYYDDNVLRLLGNYRQGLIQLAYHYLSETGDTDLTTDSGPLTPEELAMPLQDRVDRFKQLSPKLKALTALDFMEKIVPEAVVPINYDVVSLQVGRLFSQLGRPEELKKRLDKFTSSGQLAPNKAYEYGVYYLSEVESREDAERMFDLFLKDNNSFDAYQRLVYTWIQYAGDTSRAADLFRRYLERDNSRQAQIRIATQSLALGLNGLAFSILEPMLQANPNDADAVRGMVDYYDRTGEANRALSLADQWLGSHPADETMKNRRNTIALMPGK